MNVEKKEDTKIKLKAQLKRKVRPHRPAAKVLEMAIALAEEGVEMFEDKLENQKWELGYLKTLTARDIEPDKEDQES